MKYESIFRLMHLLTILLIFAVIGSSILSDIDEPKVTAVMSPELMAKQEWIEDEVALQKRLDEVFANRDTSDNNSSIQILTNFVPIVNINKAGIEDLCTLPGIGEATAVKIIDYREKYGKFKKVEDIMKVSGIGEKKFEAIRDLIIISE